MGVQKREAIARLLCHELGMVLIPRVAHLYIISRLQHNAFVKAAYPLAEPKIKLYPNLSSADSLHFFNSHRGLVVSRRLVTADIWFASRSSDLHST